MGSREGHRVSVTSPHRGGKAELPPLWAANSSAIVVDDRAVSVVGPCGPSHPRDRLCRPAHILLRLLDAQEQRKLKVGRMPRKERREAGPGLSRSWEGRSWEGRLFFLFLFLERTDHCLPPNIAEAILILPRAGEEVFKGHLGGLFAPEDLFLGGGECLHSLCFF